MAALRPRGRHCLNLPRLFIYKHPCKDSLEQRVVTASCKMCRNARDPGELSPHKDIICCVSVSHHPTALSDGYYNDPPFCRRTQDAERLSNRLEVTWFIVAGLEFESGFLQSPVCNHLTIWTSAGLSNTSPFPDPLFSIASHHYRAQQFSNVSVHESPGGFVTISGLGLAWILRTCDFYISQVLLVQHPALGTTVMTYNYYLSSPLE